MQDIEGAVVFRTTPDIAQYVPGYYNPNGALSGRSSSQTKMQTDRIILVKNERGQREVDTTIMLEVARGGELSYRQQSTQ